MWTDADSEAKFEMRYMLVAEAAEEAAEEKPEEVEVVPPPPTPLKELPEEPYELWLSRPAFSLNAFSLLKTGNSKFKSVCN